MLMTISNYFALVFEQWNNLGRLSSESAVRTEPQLSRQHGRMYFGEDFLIYIYIYSCVISPSLIVVLNWVLMSYNRLVYGLDLFLFSLFLWCLLSDLVILTKHMLTGLLNSGDFLICLTLNIALIVDLLSGKPCYSYRILMNWWCFPVYFCESFKIVFSMRLLSFLKLLLYHASISQDFLFFLITVDISFSNFSLPFVKI